MNIWKAFKTIFTKTLSKQHFHKNQRWLQILYVHLACHGLLNLWCRFHFNEIICTHSSWIFLIWNSDQSWQIKFWLLKIKAQIQNQPKNSGHPRQRYWGEENFVSVHFPPTMRMSKAIWPTLLIFSPKFQNSQFSKLSYYQT